MSIPLCIFALSILMAPATEAKEKKAKQIEQGTIISAEAGDLMCYLSVKDGKGKEHSGIGADFEVCEKAAKLINKKVKLSYKKGSVNDCESNEPCGKSKTVSLVHKITPIKK